MKKVGISIGGLQEKYGDKRALEIASEIGADCVDFNLDTPNNDYRNKDSLYSKGEEAIREYYKGLREFAESLGLEISQTHGKLPGFVNKPKEDDALVENLRLDLLASAALGAPVCVVHNSTSIFLGPNPDPVLMHRLSFDMFTRILPFAKQYGVKVATETFGDAVRFNSVDFFGDINEFEKAYDAVKKTEYGDWFTICMDTGHSNKAMRYGNPTPADVIRRLGSEISVLHLHDNDTLTDQHKIPQTGCIDWTEVMSALSETGYNGVYNLELNLKHFGDDFLIETAEFGIKVMRNLINEFEKEN